MGTFVTGIPSSLRTTIPPVGSTRINITKVIDQNDIVYGSLYNGYAVNDSRFLANVGWKVPDKDDLFALIDFIDPTNVDHSSNIGGGYLKDTPLLYWESPNVGADNSYGFNLRGSGFRLTTGAFANLKDQTNLWTSDLYSFYANSQSAVFEIFDLSPISQNNGHCVRLLKETTTLLHGETGIYIGNDGSVYNTICIGTQEWLSENLIETKFRDGDTISNVTDGTSWGSSTSAAMCYYNNDILNAYTTVVITGDPTFHVDIIGDNGYSAMGVPISRTQPLRFTNLKYGTYTITEQYVLGYTSSVTPITVTLSANTPIWDVIITNTAVEYNRLLRLTFNENVTGSSTTVNYGALYNWYAANDVRNIANTGWHMPTFAELFITLVASLGGYDVAGGKMKINDSAYWNAPNTGADNSSGWNGKASGIRSTYGLYSLLKTSAWYWTSDDTGALCDQTTLAFNHNDYWNGITTKDIGAAVRLIKDTTTLTNGQTGTYIGNDGSVYRTICIGTQEWLADNLYETKFRNGDLIPNVTDNTAWAALITAGMCYYNNDVTNSYTTISDSVSTFIGGDSTSLSAWNTFFNLPTNGHPFTSLSILGGVVSLYSLGEVETKINLFSSCTLLTEVYDNGVIIYLGANTFDGCSNLLTVSISKCASIDEYAFRYCQAMTTAYIPIATTMAQYAFYGCKLLSALDIPYYAYTSIEPYVFTGCESFTSFTFENVTLVSEGSFANCHASAYNMPLLATAGQGAFAGNPIITSYNFHALTTAGDWCFYQNDANTTIDFALLTSAGAYCWAANYLVTSVLLPNITTAGAYCFSYLYNVQGFTLSKLVTAGEGAFNNCYVSTTFYLPLMTSIGTRGFYGAYAAETITIPKCIVLGATVLDNYVFYNVATQTINLTIPYMLMSCNGGAPDGDLSYLIANNTVSIQYSDALTVDSTIVTSDKTTYTI